MTQRTDDSCTVIQAFRDGDGQALAEIYGHWSPLVYSLALRSLPGITAAEQVTQRVFTRAWVTRAGFDPGRTRLPAWLMGIAQDEIADAARGTQVQSQRLAERLVLADEMSRLGTVPRQVLRMAFDDLTHPQIAERTGLSLVTVRGHIRRSLLTLRERLEMLNDAH